jgi:hypothetical protein
LLRLTPVGEAAEEELSASDRELVAATCARRAELELRGAAAFTIITQALIDLRADSQIVDLSSRAIAEEIRHSEIYLELGSRYSPVALARPRVAPIEIPAHPGVAPDLRRVLHVVGMCSINETMACAFLELCLDGARSQTTRVALREILADEIRHARIGWAYLASPGIQEVTFREVERRLVPMLCAQLAGWRKQIETLPEGEVSEHGCPSGPAIGEASVKALHEIVLPGFAAVGLDVTEARRFVAGELPCSACGQAFSRPGRRDIRAGRAEQT